MPTLSFVRAAAAVLSTGAALLAQAAAPPSHWELVHVRSGIHANPSPVEGVVYREFVSVPRGSPWLRLYFSRIWLEKGSYLRIVSLRDGDVQTLHMHHVEQWQHSTAYFNGDTVLLEIVAGPNTGKNYVEIDKVLAGDALPAVLEDSICGTTDNRQPSSHPAAGRIDPVGCSGWIIDVPTTGTDRLHLSAGHCFSAGVLEFDVPASNANCSLVHPPANKQFAIDAASSVYVNGGPGNDYWVFRCFPNSNTNLTTFQTQGAAFGLSAGIPAVTSVLRNYGYGLDGTPTNNGAAASSCSCTNGNGVRNQVQQTHTGPLNAVAGNRLDYGFDTCGGNSGSVVLDGATNLAVAIHTHGGCTSGGGSNAGTAITHPGLQAAIQALAGGTSGTVPNDDCATALSVVDGINGPYSNSGAANSIAFPCGAGGRDIWFRYVATCSGSTTFDTCSATRTFDTVIEVFSGTCGALASLGCNDDACSLGSSLNVTLAVGVTYFVRVGGFNGAQGACDLTITSCNSADECIGAIPLRIGGNGPFATGAATNSLPAFACGLGGKDLWFVYQAPPVTNVTFSTCNVGSNFDTVIEVFSGSCGALVSLGCNDDDFGCAPSIRRSTLTVATSAAAMLYVRVGGFNGLSGTFVLDVRTSPANDDCSSAVTIGNGTSGPFSNLNANTSFAWPCAAGGSDVWFVYQASCTGTLLVDTCSAARTYDTSLEVFAGTCGNLTPLACNDDACALGSSVAVPVTQGLNYWIRLGGYFGAQGQAELNVACIVTGDECSSAHTVVDGLNGPFTTLGSTTSAPPWACGFNGGFDIWFRYTATATVPVTFWTCTSTRTFDTVIQVFDDCTALNSLACNDDFCGLGSRATVNVAQGVTYYVRVGGYNGAFGAFDLEVQPGTGGGSIVRNPHACGPTTIASSGQPRIGGVVQTQIGGVVGLPFVGLGLVPGSTPFCSCTLGHEWLTAIFASAHTLTIPLDGGLVGVQVGIQGADFLGVGGCLTPQVTFTDTMVVTIG